MEENQLLTIDQVASALQVSNLTVYRLIKRGRLRALRVGKNFRLRSTDVARYMDVRATGTDNTAY
jgi:excisionase family DNA binding protein